MRKTQFAGLTVLNPDESVTADNGAFIGRDRDTIDRFLQIGAKTHRHNGLAGLENPAAAIGASAMSSGGTIQADQTFTLTYTLEDGNGGETLIGPSVNFATQGTMDSPGNAPIGGAKYEEGGDLPTDTYYYAFSFVDDGGGETPIGPSREVQRQPGFKEAKVVLSGFAGPVTSAGAAGWRLYRAVGGGDFGYLTSGIGDAFTDDGSLQANCDLPPLEEGTNSTNGEGAFEISLPLVAEGQFINVYLTNDAAFVGDALLEQFPVSSAGQKAIYRSLALLPGQPPDVNTSIGGAHQIDPDTELIDWHWKRPVKVKGDLPDESEGTEEGDVRLVIEENAIYQYNGTEWVILEFDGVIIETGGSGSSGSGGGTITVKSDDLGAPTIPGFDFPFTSLTTDWKQLASPHKPITTSEQWSCPNPEELIPLEGGSAILYQGMGKLTDKNQVAELHFTVGAVGDEGFAPGEVGINFFMEEDPFSKSVQAIFRRDGEEIEDRLVIMGFGTSEVKRIEFPASLVTEGEKCKLRASIINGEVTIELYKESGSLVAVTQIHMTEEEQEKAEEQEYKPSFGIFVFGNEDWSIQEFKFGQEGEEGEAKDIDTLAFEPPFHVGQFPSGQANITLDLTETKGFIWCNEDITLDRPEGYGSVEWMVKGEITPENMAEHDTLIQLP